jgi:hypothetical protein
MQKMNDFTDTEIVVYDLYQAERDVFDPQAEPKYKNQRKTVRYVRKDITAFVSQADVFGTYSLFSYSRAIKVKLLDISSKGALIGGPSTLTLKMNKKIMLTLIFNSNRKFDISARVVRELIQGRRFYGIKFDKANDELGDYLLESQTDLVFK